MSEPIVITSDDSILRTLGFKPFRNKMIRRVRAFMPAPGEPQTKQITTPWGSQLTVKPGDLLVSELDRPEDVWPVAPDIFDQTYMMVRPGFCVKRAVTLLAPMTEVTHGDEDQMVTVETLEGSETVRAGDFFLAKGVKGEIWPYPKHKVSEIMEPAE